MLYTYAMHMYILRVRVLCEHTGGCVMCTALQMWTQRLIYQTFDGATFHHFFRLIQAVLSREAPTLMTF
jgi:hypothetical protein